jgi:intracellular sulfur oxidation DsrE/DsrF family protein
MSNKFKTILLTVAAAGFIFSSATVFAAKGDNEAFPGIINPCQQLWLVNDPINADRPADDGGECIDVPVNLKKVKVLFNLDNVVTLPSGDPVGLRHMAALGKVMLDRITKGLMDPKDIAIVGIFHGAAMKEARWPMMDNSDAKATGYINKIFGLKKRGVNIQLEVCGVTLKGMQQDGELITIEGVDVPLDERGIYSNGMGKIYVNQGAIGRMIDLQQNDFAYLQEE